MAPCRSRQNRARAPLTIVASTLAIGLTARQWATAGMADQGFLNTAPRSMSKLAPPAVKEREGSDEAASAANLAKSVIGAGVLALPGSAEDLVSKAEAAGVGHDTALTSLVAMFTVFAALNASGFYLIADTCARTGAKSFQEAWSRTIGTSTAWMPALASLICCLTGTVACASVIGGTATDLVSAATGAHLTSTSHDALLFGLSGTILLPLCLLPSLAPLAFASALGLAGVLLLAVIMVVRMADGSYLPGGEFADAVASVTSAAEAVATFSDPAAATGGDPMKAVMGSSLLFIAVLSNAFSAHYNAPVLYEELQDPESQQDPEQPAGTRAAQEVKLGSFQKVTNQAFGFAAVICMIVALAGLQTFGTATQPMILDNFAHSDSLVFFAKAGLGLCVLFEFPLLERCFRTTTAELIGLPEVGTHPAAVACSVFLAAMIACMPGLDYEAFAAIGGAAGASFLTYVAPALMALKLRSSDPSEVEAADYGTSATEASFDASRKATTRAVEAMMLRTLALSGVALGGLGVAQAAGFGI